MKHFELSRYIRKWLPLIIVACIIITIASYFVISGAQSYEASAVIRYENENMNSGLAPDGKKFDAGEIKSSAVLSQAITELKLDPQLYSVDSLSSRIIITEKLDPDEEALKTSKLENGEEYESYPDTFVISFTATSSEGAGFARTFLEKVLSCYFSEYAKNYLNTASLTDNLSNIDTDIYDYIEILNIIDSSVDNALNTLYSRVSANSSFRSVETGYSFNDLATKFAFVRDVKLAALYTTVLDNQLTRDKTVLAADYGERIKENTATNEADDIKIEDLVEIIDEYVLKMRESGNTDITAEYILDDVYGRLENGEYITNGDGTVTYDKLIFLWREYTAEQRKNLIQSAYYQYIINEICGCRGECEDEECLSSDKTCKELTSEDYNELCDSVVTKSAELIDELSVLYNYAKLANDEYNDYLGAQNITTLSSVSVYESMNVKLYMVLICVVVLLVGCGGAIVAGRINDIIDFMFYTDRLTGLSNRNGIDNYMKRLSYKVLDNGNICATFNIMNMYEINDSLSRSGGDELIKYVANLIREIFADNGESYIGYNGKAQYVIFTSGLDFAAAQYMLNKVGESLEAYMQEKKTDVVYTVGLAETAKHGVRNVRSLLMRAMSESGRHEFKAKKPENDENAGENGKSGE